MYISILSTITGWAVFFESWAILRYAAAVGLFFYFFVLLVEEPLLRKKFGKNYESYCREVARWLPKRTRKHAA
jgi:protein-S-isoprenylcysteine O-methyltransferase Ste14